MKTINKIAVTVAASLLLGAAAQAQVNIRISGAVAFRAQTSELIRSLYDPGFQQNPANAANATLAAWSGTASNKLGTGAQIVNIYVNYNGAVAGIQNLTIPSSAQFLTSFTPGVTTTAPAPVDFSFSSIYQNTSPYTSPVLDDPQNFGVTPILWIKSTNSHPGLTNITSKQIQQIASLGYAPVGFFTGDTNETDLVHFVTRDATAGQRLIVFKDAGYTAATPQAYQNNGTSWVFDSGGRTSTGQVITQLNTYSNAISYLTGVDAVSAVTNGPTGAKILSYNGVFPLQGATTLSTVSNNWTPVITGQYSLWGYEHLLKPSSLAGTALTVYSALTNSLSTNVSSQYTIAPIDAIRVERTSDGGVIAPLF